MIGEEAWESCSVGLRRSGLCERNLRFNLGKLCLHEACFVHSGSDKGAHCATCGSALGNTQYGLDDQVSTFFNHIVYIANKAFLESGFVVKGILLKPATLGPSELQFLYLVSRESFLVSFLKNK